MADIVCHQHTGMIEQMKAVCVKIELLERMNEKALELARHDMERRLEGMNEFRAQLSKQATEFISKNELQLLLDKVALRLDPIEKSINMRQGSSKWSDYIIIVIIAFITSFVSNLIMK